MEAKANINLTSGVIELQGSEQFVSKYLDIYKDLLIPRKLEGAEALSEPDHKPKKKDQETVIDKKSNSGSRKSVRSAKTKTIAIEKFDIHKDSKNISLENFLKEKSPGKTTANIIAVIGYYITQLKGHDTFSEGNIDYAYRTIPIPGRPGHLHQIMINAKNKQDFFEPTEEDGKWKLTRTGEIFVEEKLPIKS